MQLDQMKIVVTGGASGMGRHFSLALARAGAHVAACDLNEEGLASLAAEADGLKLNTYTCNVADETQVEAMFDQAWQDLGGLNGLVNNAGIFRDGLLVKKDRTTGAVRSMSLKNWQMVIDVDLTGPFLCTRALASRMLENDQRDGVIVNISSIARHGNMGQGNYSAAKAGLVADTVVWAKELARYNIRLGAIAPGFVDTPILQGMKPEVLEKMLKAVPLRRVGSVESIFAGIKFIIECDYFTGRCIDIDGGMRL
ncbi:MAG: 3-oxoacyl-[acyl-carrier protein] reductase [Bradymonadia bacterium]|jgi:3-oxoacyl-[acyl-carrier protein] reductase